MSTCELQLNIEHCYLQSYDRQERTLVLQGQEGGEVDAGGASWVVRSVEVTVLCGSMLFRSAGGAGRAVICSESGRFVHRQCRDWVL